MCALNQITVKMLKQLTTPLNITKISKYWTTSQDIQCLLPRQKSYICNATLFQREFSRNFHHFQPRRSNGVAVLLHLNSYSNSVNTARSFWSNPMKQEKKKIPRLILLQNPWTWLMVKLDFTVLRNLWDPTFHEKEFKYGATQCLGYSDDAGINDIRITLFLCFGLSVRRSLFPYVAISILNHRLKIGLNEAFVESGGKNSAPAPHTALFCITLYMYESQYDEAIYRVTQVISEGQMTELNGLLTRAARFSLLRELDRNWPEKQRPLLALKGDDIQISTPRKVYFIRIADKKYCDVDMAFLALKWAPINSVEALIFAEILARFHREYTPASIPEWTIAFFKIARFQVLRHSKNDNVKKHDQK